MPSSPIRRDARQHSPPRRDNAKERRNPSITPRKFRRFFTPRPRVPSHLAPGHISPARKALRDLAAPELNRNDRLQTPAPSSPLRAPSEDVHIRDENAIDNTRAKRRKIHHTPDSSPCQPTIQPALPAPPIDRQSALLSPMRSLHSSQETVESDESDDDDDDLFHQRPARRLAPVTARGFVGHLLQREMGGMPRAGRSYMAYPVSDWRTETANFYSRPDNVHNCISHDGPGRCIPFCTAACHTNGLVAVGDEEGRVRLLDSSGDTSQPFSKIHLSFPAHSNAIIDLTFSDDDYLLATASGDQTGRVIDMITQTPVALLHGHTASLKQVRFQPGRSNGSVLATSSRDGSVQIWDLRCKGPVSEMSPQSERDSGLTFRRPPPKEGCAVNSIYDAHARTSRQVKQAAAGGPGDMPSRGELPGRIGDVSVTALQFLPEGQEHLLLTACEADASIKLWDIRSTTTRHRTSTPISVTAPPTSHSHWRPFGIPSLTLSTDASRLYALCKDNTVYAYSMAHLILGHAPELSTREPARRRHGNTTHNGLGPIYGFRHPSLHATSFYVKAAIRPAKDGRSELLAVGSSDSCAVVFPTAERHFRPDLSGAMSSLSLSDSTIAASASSSLPPSAFTRSHRPPLFQRAASSTNLAAMREKDDIPIIRNVGTPLVRGHDREVGSLTWTEQGKLITIGDDYLIRCWSEDREQAMDLRTGGETEGRRWGCGWADVGEGWDGDSEDDE
ncbi:WD40-repeat-containing domain protein [Truncatella angustata]|uniref:WD40-repeat-containing domain protein n=1 Tax=Truncatella angustata TaxID=152316 RepID=A0A9P8UFY4_9PEZI|nr:WD40-repeat-containing domain protein [Truncatella angustata]KAH6649098.1 WD40-repeat-containing domain protein [Truncatella angustata]